MFRAESLAAAKAGERALAKEELCEKASTEAARAATNRAATVFMLDKGCKPMNDESNRMNRRFMARQTQNCELVPAVLYSVSVCTGMLVMHGAMA